MDRKMIGRSLNGASTLLRWVMSRLPSISNPFETGIVFGEAGTDVYWEEHWTSEAMAFMNNLYIDGYYVFNNNRFFFRSRDAFDSTQFDLSQYDLHDVLSMPPTDEDVVVAYGFCVCSCLITSNP